MTVKPKKIKRNQQKHVDIYSKKQVDMSYFFETLDSGHVDKKCETLTSNWIFLKHLAAEDVNIPEKR